MAPKSVKVHGLWKSKDPPYIYSIALYKFNGLFFFFFFPGVNKWGYYLEVIHLPHAVGPQETLRLK